MPSLRARTRYSVLWVVAALAIASSASPVLAQKSAGKLAASKQSFRDGIVGVRDRVGSTLAALDEIVEGKDATARKNALKKYGGEIKEMDKQIDKTEKYAAELKEQGEAFFKDWDKSMKSVSNETLKASANERRQAVETQHKRIEEEIGKAKEIGPSFRKNLKDLQGYFAANVSDEAVATSKKLVETVHGEGKTIQGHLDAVIDAIDGKTEAQPAAAGETQAEPEAAAAATATEEAKPAEPAKEEPKPEEPKPEEPAPTPPPR